LIIARLCLCQSQSQSHFWVSSTISLNCWILGDDLKELLLIPVSRDEPFVYVKYAIEKENPESLKNVGRRRIVLHKVSIVRGDAFEDKVSEIIANTDPFRFLTLISDAFPPVVDKQYVYLIVSSLPPDDPG
jgi:serine/threonine protein phosphatase PrpC